MGDEDDIGGETSDVIEEDDDTACRRDIRSKYRDLIHSVQQNRKDMLNSANNKLMDVLEQANKLFASVKQTREASLDAKLLVLATDLGMEKAGQLHAESSAFDPSAFAQHLLSFMRLNRLEEDDEDRNGNLNGYLPQDAWQKLAKRSEGCFKTAPSFHYMLGSFISEPPAPQKEDRQRTSPTKGSKLLVPVQLKKMESHQQATEKEVERILGWLQSYCANDPEEPISYYKFVVDPKSFSRTVENIFHTSFLIRDGLARLYLDEDGLPCIALVKDGKMEPGGASAFHQCVTSISQTSWRGIIEAFDIKEALIPAAKVVAQEH